MKNKYPKHNNYYHKLKLYRNIDKMFHFRKM